MALLDVINTLSMTSRAQRYGAPDTSHIRIMDPEVVPRTEVLLQNGLFARTGELSEYALHRAYRSVVFMLAGYRAQNFARQLLASIVERQVGQGEFEPVELQHPWTQLLQRPNDYMHPLECWQWASIQRDLGYGAHFVVETDRRGVPYMLHPVYESDGRVTPMLDRVGRTIGWVFHRNDGQQISLEAGDIVRVAHMHPFERGRAVTLIEAAAYEIDEQRAQAVYARDSAHDKGRPDVILETDQTITEEEGNRISRIFGARYKTGSRHQGVPWTGSGLRLREFALSQRDQQFLETRKFTKDLLFEIFGTPPALFDSEAYATGKSAAKQIFAENTVQPNVDLMAGQLEHGFEIAFGADPAALRIQSPNVVPVNRKEQAEIDTIRILNGTTLINEVRRREGDEEYTNGGEPLIGGLVTRLAEIVQTEENADADPDFL